MNGSGGSGLQRGEPEAADISLMHPVATGSSEKEPNAGFSASDRNEADLRLKVSAREAT